MEKLIANLIKKDIEKLGLEIKPLEIAKKIVAAMTKAESTKNSILDYENEIEKLAAKHKNEVSAIRSRISELRKSCGHEDTTYYPDASGNNDSYTECNICGSEV